MTMPPSPPLSPWPEAMPVRWTARAPGRVNLIGEHVDYNGGWVLPMAIEREVVIRAGRRPDRIASFTSSLCGETLEFRLDTPLLEYTGWGLYLQGVLIEFRRETGEDLPGFQAVIDSTVPRGGGLSSSAALCVAAVTLLEKISGHSLTPIDKALLCQRVEHDYAGVPCGLMDQLASTLCRAGHLLLIDCTTNETRPIAFPDRELAVLVTNTGVSHALADGAYAERRMQCRDILHRTGATSFRALTETDLRNTPFALDETLQRRARHVITENARTLATAEAFEAGHWDRVSENLYASHASLKNDYEVSCPELDCLVDAARDRGPAGGVIGARMTGGGFGGCTVTLVRREHAADVAAGLKQRFAAVYGREPECFVTRAAQGAG